MIEYVPIGMGAEKRISPVTINGSAAKILKRDEHGNLFDSEDSSGFNIRCVDLSSDKGAIDFTTSLKETGFAVLKTHPVDWKLVEGVYAEWRAFLKSLDENIEQNKTTKKYMFSSENQDGYFPRKVAETAKGSKVKDMKHFYHLYFPQGRYPDEVSDQAQELWKQMTDLGVSLLKMIEEHMDPEVRKMLKMPLSESIGLDRTLLRVLHYPAYEFGEEEPGAVRAAAHEDINFITILPVGSSRGLQVWSKEHQQWYEVPQEERSLIVNIGDMLQELTNKEYISTTHRVVKPADEPQGMDRMSVPCFVHPKSDTYLSERYPEANIFLTERLREIGIMK